MKLVKLFFLCFIVLDNQKVHAQRPSDFRADSIMITIFLKHQQDKNLDSLRVIQKKNKFIEQFPPTSARVVSWYVMMGIGQVVTVKIPVSELRTLNLSIERGAWGAFNTEFYPTYDFVPIWKASQVKSQ